MQQGTLILENGSKFDGFVFGASTNTAGEVVFQTGMVGYVESLTDPSYCGQILVLTFPLIGNYGVPDEKVVDDFGLLRWVESNKIYASALIVSSYTEEYSHWNAVESLSSWLKKHNIPALYGIDTRILTKKLCEHGTMLGKIVMKGTDPKSIPFHDQNKTNLMAQVSIQKPCVFNPTGKISIACIDCGLKNNQLRILCQLGAKVTVVPWNYPVKQDEFDGLLLSNGPGDPQTQCSDTIATITSWINSQTIKPIFGIGLGHQLMALAAGMKTVKLKHGSRGHNQEQVNVFFITSQNHGFAVDKLQGLAKDWHALFTNKNDDSNEGIIHDFKPFFGVQFHPEHCAGPRDTKDLFQIFLDVVQSYKSTTPINLKPYLMEQLAESFNNKRASPENSYHPVRKILILGSRDSSTFGQAGGYYDAATQATEAINQHGIATVVINSNLDLDLKSKQNVSNKIFLISITEDIVKRVIVNESPSGILLSCGGKAALNCGVELHKSGFLEEYSCNVLGTPIESIQITQDRSLFTQHMADIGEKVVPYEVVNSLQAALKSAERFGYPVLVRYDVVPLEDRRSSYANNREELISLVNSALIDSSELLIDKSVKGWKKVRYEVVRDQYDNCIVICNMENIFPLALRTGESIVVAPSQTLSNDEYNLLRSVSIKVVRYLRIIGACNVQFALNPLSSEYYIMRVNTQLSCSSALASKATGYPLAYITAELAIGMKLIDINNSIADDAFACTEPSLDYIVIKVPKLDLRKFLPCSNKIENSESVDEVMAIGRSFEEAFQQALRMIDEDVIGFHPYSRTITDDELSTPTDECIFLLATALHQGYTIERLFELTKIDRWFLHKFQSIIQFIVHHFNSSIIQNQSLLLEAKRLGFSDKQISLYCGSTEVEVCKSRQEFVIRPLIKQIDGVSGEWPAQINYFYLTYHGNQDDTESFPTSILVIGSYFYPIENMSSSDKDFSFIGSFDLLNNLRKSFKLDDDTEDKIIEACLKRLEDADYEVQDEAVKFLECLKKKSKR